MTQETKLTASKIDELTNFDLTRSLEGKALYCETPKVRKNGNIYEVTISQVYIDDYVYTEYFTGEMKLIASVDVIAWKIEYDKKLSDFVILETDVVDCSEIDVFKTENDYEHSKRLFLYDWYPPDYMEEKAITQDELTKRLKEPFRTWFIEEHRDYER